MAFKIGDRVRIAWSPTPARVGVIATVIEVTQVVFIPRQSRWHGVLSLGERVCTLDLRPVELGCGCVQYPPRFLEPYYEDRDPVAWEDCLWQPKKETVPA